MPPNQATDVHTVNESGREADICVLDEVLLRKISKTKHESKNAHTKYWALSRMDTAWQLSVVPEFVKHLAQSHNAHDEMQRFQRCDKCHRNDVECILDVDNLNSGHWRESLLPSGDLVDGALFHCPTGKHVICARCIRDNWWSIKARNQGICGCTERPWTLSMAILAGVSLTHILKLWKAPCQNLPARRPRRLNHHFAICKPRREPMRCPHSLDDLNHPMSDNWCLCCSALSRYKFIDKTPCALRPAPEPLPPKFPPTAAESKPGPASLKSMCLWNLSTLETTHVQQQLALELG